MYLKMYKFVKCLNECRVLKICNIYLNLFFVLLKENIIFNDWLKSNF